MIPSGTHFTDARPVHLRGLTKFQDLNLSDSQVTDAGVAELNKSLPNILIIR
jgi:hypothetical protein